MDKTSLRKEMRKRRRSVSISGQKKAACRLSATLHSDMRFCHARRVAVYLQNDGEIGTLPLIKTLQVRKVEVYLPVLHPLKKGHLVFILYNKNTPMRKNCYGIAEPDFRHSRRVQARFISQICLPLVAFDPMGNRIGMGGGYYDRTLAFCRKKGTKPRLIGSAYEFQRVAALPADGWDIPLSAIATDAAMRTVSGT
jgi:5-formyltetrahydrofolate cyclo-ligase